MGGCDKQRRTWRQRKPTSSSRKRHIVSLRLIATRTQGWRKQARYRNDKEGNLRLRLNSRRQQWPPADDEWRPGEVVTAGTAIATLLDLKKVYLRGYVPEGQIGKVALGQAAHIYLDSRPNEPIDGYVSRIDPQATFTPENTYFRDDRVKQVVGVKVQLKGAVGFAKPGMPADGEILVGSTWPSGHRP